MPADVTLEEIWELFRETDRKIAAVAEQQAKTEAQMARTDAQLALTIAQSARTDAQLAKTDAQLAKTDAQLAKTDAQVAATSAQLAKTDAQVAATSAQLAKTDAQLASTDAQLAATTALVDRVVRSVDDLTGKWGKFVEGIVAPACDRLFAERGIPVHSVFQRARVRLGGRTMEIDLLVVNEGHVVLVEVKSTLKVEDVRDHLERLAEFKAFFPVYADRKVLGAVAGIVIDEGVDTFATRHGLFVIAQSGDSVRLLNDPDFAPRAW